MKKILLAIMALTATLGLSGCDERMGENSSDIDNQLEVQDKHEQNQPTPTDINQSLERFNLIKRAYWVNGMRSKANNLPLPIADMPLGQIVLFSGPSVVAKFDVVGKVSSLNSYLTPDCYWVQNSRGSNGAGGEQYCVALADVDGSYGVNDDGIFFFTTTGEYVEWNGTYIYSDINMDVDNPTINIGGTL